MRGNSASSTDLLCFYAFPILLALAFRNPDTLTASAFAFLGALLLVRACSDIRRFSLGRWYFAGLVFYAPALWWMPHTIISYFGFLEPPRYVAVIGYLATVGVLALQFPLCGFILRLGRDRLLSACCLSVPLAWTISEQLFYRPFPWFYGNLFLAVPALNQLADVLGPGLVTLVALWIAALVASLLFDPAHQRRRAIGLVSLLCAAMLYRVYRAQVIEAQIFSADKVRIALVQGNDPVMHTPSAEQVTEKVGHYLALTANLNPQPEVVLWPEGPFLQAIPEDTSTLNPSFYTEAKPIRRSLLFAGHTFTPTEDRRSSTVHTSAMVLGPDGTLSIGYQKRYTIPFAETVPLMNSFPILERLFGPRFFVPGTTNAIVSIPLPKGRGGMLTGPPLRAAVLICYEDTIPELFRDMVSSHDAEVLISLANGQWFGSSEAVTQHASLASWRAIENGRFLVRATTTGSSRVVSPLGEVLYEIPLFTSAASSVLEIPRLSGNTLFSQVGMWPLRLVAVLLLVLGLARRVMWGR